MKKQKTVKLKVEDLEERIAPSLMLSTPGVEKFLALGGNAHFGIGHHHHGGEMHGGHHGHGWWGRDGGGETASSEPLPESEVVAETTSTESTATTETTTSSVGLLDLNIAL